MKTLFKNAFFKSLLQISNIVIPVVIGMIVLRILGQNYDSYTYVDSFLQIFLLFGVYGVYQYGVREGAKIRGNKEESNQLFTQLFTLSTIINIVVVAVYTGFVFAIFQGEENQTKLLVSLFCMLQFVGNFFNVEWANEATEHYTFISVKAIVCRALYLVLSILLVTSPNDIVLYVAILSGAAALDKMTSFFYILRYRRFDFRNFTLKKHILPVIAMFFVSSVMLLYAQLNKVLLSFSQSVLDVEVTFFTLSQHMSYMIYSVVISLATVTIPKLSNMLANGEHDEAFNLHSNVTNILMLLLIPALMGVGLLSQQVSVIYGGDRYVDMKWILTMFCVVQLFCGVHYVYGESLMYICGKEKRLLVHNLIGAAFNIITSFILVWLEQYNAFVATIVLAGSYLIVAILDMIYVRKHLGYKYKLFNKHTILYLGTASLFIPIVIFTEGPIYALTSGIPQSSDLIFLAIMVIVCAFLYISIVASVEIFGFKNRFLLEKIQGIKAKLFRK